MSLMGKCCCECACSCLPSTISFAISNFSGGSPLCSWSGLSAQTAYKCCATDPNTGLPYIYYRMNPVVVGSVSSSTPSGVKDLYLVVGIIVGQDPTLPSSTNCTASIHFIIGASSIVPNPPNNHECVVPRTISSGNSCDGISQNFYCSPTVYSNFLESFFEPGNFTGCTCGASANDIYNGYFIDQSTVVADCSFTTSPISIVYGITLTIT